MTVERDIEGDNHPCFCVSDCAELSIVVEFVNALDNEGLALLDLANGKILDRIDGTASAMMSNTVTSATAPITPPIIAALFSEFTASCSVLLDGGSITVLKSC